MIEDNLDLPKRLARRFSAGSGLTLEERESAAAFGLVMASEAYRGSAEGFRKYAAAYAWGEMRRERRRLLLSRHLGVRDAMVCDRPAAANDGRLSRLAGLLRLRSMPTRHRNVIRSLLRGETTGAISRRMGVSRSTVERWRDEAIAKLRRLAVDAA